MGETVNPGRPRKLQHFAGGEPVEMAGEERQDLLDPSTEEVLASAPIGGPDAVQKALEAARQAFPTWRDRTPAERSLALWRIADSLEAHGEELFALECENTGKPYDLTLAEELPQLLDHVRFFAGAARLLEGRSAGEYLAGHTSYVRREPVGVCAAVTPWNYPLLMAVWKWAPALAAGNTMVLKPAETTPLATLRMAELMNEHLPSGAINVICGGRDTGRLLVAHDIPAMVSVTGSVRAGTEVAQAAAGGLKRVHLELGGKAPVIVFDDADLEATAAGIAAAGYFNAGQDCTAATRVLATPRIHEKLAEALAGQANDTKVGGRDVADAYFGPLNNADQLARVRGFLGRMPSHASVLHGGARVGSRGYLFAPTVVAGLRQDDELSQEEIFGPVITVQAVDDEEAAVAAANGVRYGLASSVWTRDHARAMRVSKALDFGAVWVNAHIPLVAEMPHGGFKSSGYGKDLSLYGFDDYTRLKHVMHRIEP